MFAGLASSFQATLAQPALLAIGAGLLAGAVAGTVVVASGVLSSPASQTLALVACPGSDRVVARVAAGDSALVTARSADGAWLELYVGEPGLDSAWAPRTAARSTACRSKPAGRRWPSLRSDPRPNRRPGSRSSRRSNRSRSHQA